MNCRGRRRVPCYSLLGETSVSLNQVDDSARFFSIVVGVNEKLSIPVVAVACHPHVVAIIEVGFGFIVLLLDDIKMLLQETCKPPLSLVVRNRHARTCVAGDILSE